MKNLALLVRRRRECLAYLEIVDHPPEPQFPAPSELRVDQGTTTSLEQAFLRELVAQSAEHPGPIIEIGTLFGFTTNEIALAKSAAQKLITVDQFSWNPWGLNSVEHQRLTERVLRLSTALLNVTLVVADKNQFYAGYVGEAPALVFLDAAHSYEETRKDIEWAQSLRCPLIAGHDYSDEFPGVQTAVDEAGAPEVRGTIWLIRSTPSANAAKATRAFAAASGGGSDWTGAHP